MKSTTVHFGQFDDTGKKKWVVKIDDDFLTHEDAHGHRHITTFRSQDAAMKKATEIGGRS